MHTKQLSYLLIYEWYSVWCVQASLGFVDFPHLFQSTIAVAMFPSLPFSAAVGPAFFIFSLLTFILLPRSSLSFYTSLNHCPPVLHSHPSHCPLSLLCLIHDSQPLFTFILSSSVFVVCLLPLLILHSWVFLKGLSELSKLCFRLWLFV